MKKIIYSLLFFLLVAATGCEKFEAGGTATQNLSGDWWVKVELDNGDNSWTDLTTSWLGVERIMVNTYNTADNVPTEIFVDDNKNFWEFKGKVKADAANFTFGSDDEVQNYHYDSKFKVTEGKVLEGVGRSQTGVITDSIVFVVRFDDDTPPYGDTYRISGHRRTGFNEDEY